MTPYIYSNTWSQHDLFIWTPIDPNSICSLNNSKPFKSKHWIKTHKIWIKIFKRNEQSNFFKVQSRKQSILWIQENLYELSVEISKVYDFNHLPFCRFCRKYQNSIIKVVKLTNIWNENKKKLFKEKELIFL